jgi:hypothetical protein
MYSHSAGGIEGTHNRLSIEKEVRVMNRILSFIAILALAGSQALSPWPAPKGNVQVSVVNGNLIIQGDSRDNNVIFTEGNITGRASTTINGQRSIFPPEGVTGDIVINMKGGNDFVRVELPGTNFAVQHDLEINMGAGNDNLELLQVKVPEETRIDTAGGHDIIFIDGVLGVNDYIRSEFTGKFQVETGNGEDLLEFHHTIFSGEVDVDLGSGVDGACSTEDSEFLMPDQAVFNAGPPNEFPGDGFVAPSTEFTNIINFENFPDDCSYLGGRF